MDLKAQLAVVEQYRRQLKIEAGLTSRFYEANNAGEPMEVLMQIKEDIHQMHKLTSLLRVQMRTHMQEVHQGSRYTREPSVLTDPGCAESFAADPNNLFMSHRALARPVYEVE